MFDIIIIGAGPAGLSAAITARARDKKVLVISNMPQESPLAKAKLIDNYPGLPQVSGLHLLKTMVSHAHGLGAEFIYDRVISVLPLKDGFVVATGSANFDARSIILATGMQLAKPFVGEAEFLGKGVSYCATCDGMLYRTQTVCVVGLNAEAETEANFLASIGAQVIFLAKKAPQGLDKAIMVEEGTVKEITGDERGVTALVFKAKQTGKIESISCGGVFILRPSIAPDALTAGLALSDGHVATDAAMSTNIPGVFAAGDCVGKPLQVAKAVGEGQCACFSAVQYLDTSAF
ncbi:MAG: NAD(P)/FAD-dependent oxidoreductase [Coriobacteriales bacterium]|jgi:thioredoxin reductase (NADPH)|nr:NAD(P)/FAD-dependent oxidoreductase [Coriobacteriales bacterium]